MAQIFIESVFRKHDAWLMKMSESENYKTLIQSRLQKEFKVVPIYKKQNGYNKSIGFVMHIYLCVRCPESIPFDKLITHSIQSFTSFESIHTHIHRHKYICVLLATATHQNKLIAEQNAAQSALNILSEF